MEKVAIEMNELQYEYLNALVNQVSKLQDSNEVLYTKIMHLQNDLDSSISDFNSVMSVIQDNINQRDQVMLELGKTIFLNREFYDIVIKGDADE